MNSTQQLLSFKRKHRKSKTINHIPVQRQISVTYTKFIQNLKNLLKNPQKYKKRFFNSKSHHKENALFLVIRKYIVEAMTYEGVVNVLKKEKHFRTKQEIKAIAEFLALKNDFFNKLKQSNQSTLYAVVNVLNIETYNQGDTIINYGEEGDKLYVVLEGKVAVYKPKQIEKEMQIKDFISYLRKLKFNSTCPYVLQRVEEYNKYNYNIEYLKENNYDYDCVKDLNSIKCFIVEDYNKVFEGGEGTSFGEVALIQKTTRNATIIAQTKTNIASLDKEDYHSLMRIIEARKYYDRISQMKHKYLIVRSWTNQSIIRLINNLVTYNMLSGDILYHQGDICDGIYFVLSGTFEISMEVNDELIEETKKYIKLRVNNLFEFIQNYRGKKIPTEKAVIEFITNGNELVGSFPSIKKGKDNSEKIILRKVNANECFGLEDMFELKKRFYSVTCTSVNAQVQKIQMIDLVNILFKCNQESIDDIQQYIQEKKTFILKQICNYFKVKETNIININNNNEHAKINEIFESNYIIKEKRHNLKMNKTIDKVSDGLFKYKPILNLNKLKTDDNNNNNNMNNNGLCSYFKQISPQQYKDTKSLYSRYFQNTNNSNRSNGLNEIKNQKLIINNNTNHNNNLSRNNHMKTITTTASYSLSSLSPCKNGNKNYFSPQITPNLKKNVSHITKCSPTITCCKSQQQSQCLYKSFQKARTHRRNKSITSDLSMKLIENEKCNTQIYNNLKLNGRTLSEEKINCLLTEGYPSIKKISQKEIMKMAGIFRSYRKDINLHRKIMIPQVCVISPLVSSVTLMNVNGKNIPYKRINISKSGRKQPVRVVFQS